MPGWLIQRSTPDDWQRVRAIRLRALADAPDAFGTTLAEDEARPLAEWRERLTRGGSATFVATQVEGGADVGLVTGAAYDGRAGDAGLFGMWVAAPFRGRGVASALVDAVIAWARASGYHRLLLDVGDDNLAAIRLYEAKGFVPTGARGSLPPPRDHVPEHERVLFLRPGAREPG